VSLGPVWQTVLGALVVVALYMTAWFVVALIARRNDLADVAWGIGFITIAAWLLTRAGAPLTLRQFVVTALVVVWGSRLAWHIGRRNLRPGKTEDERYAGWRRDWGRWFVLRSYLQVFLLQGLFMILISMPVLVAGSGPGAGIGVLDVLGVLVWLCGFAFESVGDAQLARFLGDPANRGHVMDRGLWAWTRHPNYFGEATMWFGLALIALGVPGGWVALIGPITITWLLTKVSGIPLAEASFKGQPEWEAYKARTSAFIPMRPKKA